MIQALLFFWIASALLIIHESKIFRLIIYLAVFSLFSSLCFLFFGAPDVAMAEAVVSTLSTVIFIVSFEKYYSLPSPAAKEKARGVVKHILPVVFSVFLFALFLWFIPGDDAKPYLKNQYLSMFSHDIGGENAVTAIYLGYRMYDTLFEALMLLISIIAVIHLSLQQETLILSGKRRDVNRSDVTFVLVRIICPVLLLFGVYLILNGHNSPGGGFQGGVVLASFFICRYMIHAIHDIRINSVIMLEKVIYVGIVLLAGFFVFLSANSYLPLPKSVYLVMMNLFIGMKVACGFLIIFYRFIAFEWR